jgi:hypothetical protein
MANKSKSPMTLRHLYATTAGLVLLIAGWYLYSSVTGCRVGNSCKGPYGVEGVRLYEHRPYGVAVIIVSIVFIVAVVRDARRNVE